MPQECGDLVDSLTVVIPTNNREAILKKAIKGYLDQTALQSIRELIVVDDGSTDNTGAMVKEVSTGSPFEIRYFLQANKGPAAARNLGIREATSGLILFTDDDIIPSPGLVAEHLGWHGRFREPYHAVLGHVTWAPEVNPTPFMKWYGSEALFSYALFEGQTELEYIYFYTCNVSVKTEFLRINGIFDEDFKTAAWEDIELAFRLNKAGMRLLYNPTAWACHHQYVSFDDACRRLQKARQAYEVYQLKEAARDWPTATTSPLKRHIKKSLASALSPLRGLADCKLPLPRSVYRAMYRLFG